MEEGIKKEVNTLYMYMLKTGLIFVSDKPVEFYNDTNSRNSFSQSHKTDGRIAQSIVGLVNAKRVKEFEFNDSDVIAKWKEDNSPKASAMVAKEVKSKEGTPTITDNTPVMETISNN